MVTSSIRILAGRHFLGYKPAGHSGLGWVVQRLDNTIHRINHYPVDSMVCFADTYPLESNLFGGWHIPASEKLGPEGSCHDNHIEADQI